MKKLLLPAFLLTFSVLADRKIHEGALLFCNQFISSWKTEIKRVYDQNGNLLNEFIDGSNEFLIPYIQLIKQTTDKHTECMNKYRNLKEEESKIWAALQSNKITQEFYKEKALEHSLENKKISETCSSLFSLHVALNKKLDQRIEEIIQGIALRYKAAGVLRFSSGIYINPDYDITQEVIDTINAEYIAKCVQACDLHCTYKS